MPEFVYEAPRPYSREEAEKIFASGDTTAISQMMIGLAFYDDDWRWVQSHCLALSLNEESHLRYISALCISHLARIHRELDLGKVRAVLLRLEKDADARVRGMADDAIEDIQHLMRIDLRNPNQFN